MSEWMTLRELVEHSKLSLSTLKRAITATSNPLPSYLIAGRRLIKPTEYEAWAAAHRDSSHADAKHAVASVLGRLR